MQPIRLFAATGGYVVRLDSHDGERFETTAMLPESKAQSVAVDPANPDRVYVGTFDDGIYRTLDGGAHWEQVGESIPHQRVLSIAISPSDRVNGLNAVFAGTEPSNLYRSEDDGATWQEFSELPKLPSSPGWSFPPRPWTSHVRWIAPHHADPNLLHVGIELGGVMRSTDGGATWEDRKPGSYHDSHAVLTHPIALERVYEAAGGGVALSTDAGETWREVDDGMDRHYVWGLAVDPADPDLWYVSASHSARYAHGRNGQAEAHLYRKRGDQPWELLTLGQPNPLPYMPYALLTLREQPNTLLAGMNNGQIIRSDDAGDSWRTLDVDVNEILALAEA
jgi:photosystem II stability/assembly factor-like uncharacterized protein